MRTYSVLAEHTPLDEQLWLRINAQLKALLQVQSLIVLETNPTMQRMLAASCAQQK